MRVGGCLVSDTRHGTTYFRVLCSLRTYVRNLWVIMYHSQLHGSQSLAVAV